jgi:hypothetical protein
MTRPRQRIWKTDRRYRSRLFNLRPLAEGDFLRTPSQMMEKLAHLADVISYRRADQSQLQVMRR